MTIKNYAKIEEKLTCRFKIDITVRRILTQAIECLKNLHFHGLLLTEL